MLSLTRKTDYALVALAYLAQTWAGGESSVSARRIADQFGLPLALLMNILKELVHAGMVKSTRGPSGGYSLAVPPQRLSLLEVVTAMEGPIRIAQCGDDEPVVGGDAADAGAGGGEEATSACQASAAGCPLRDPIRRLHERLSHFLETVTLADLLESKVDVPLTRVNVEGKV